MVSRKILLIRNDKLGDFMLAWPAMALIKMHWPEAQVTALVPAYTAPMAQLCSWIDDVLIDDQTESAGALAGRLRSEQFDAMVALFSTSRVALAGWLARIPYRLAPATKLAQFFYTHREVQRRSRSEKPEYVYNRDLAVRFLRDHGIASEPLPQPPYLAFAADEIAARRALLVAENGWAADSRIVFVHPGSGGSASNLSVAQYAHLMRELRAPKPLAFVVTAGPGEEAMARALLRELGELPAALYHSTAGLEEFARQVACADLFVSGSTGTLHIAGALDVPTAAFYPRRRSATPLRWQTLNSPERRLAFTPPETAGEFEMSAIDLEQAAGQISAVLLR